MQGSSGAGVQRRKQLQCIAHGNKRFGLVGLRPMGSSLGVEDSSRFRSSTFVKRAPFFLLFGSNGQTLK